MNLAHKDFITSSNSTIKEEREKIELEFLNKKVYFVNILSMVFGFAVIGLLIANKSSLNTIIVYLLFILFCVFVNLSLYAYNEENQNTKLIMYINSLAVYMISSALFIEFKSPSTFTSLFLAYALVAICQDKKTAVLNNIAIFSIGAAIVWRNSTLFLPIGTLDTQIWYVYLFLLIFMAFLSIASFILIKRNSSFFDQLAKIKENEIRNISIVQDLDMNYRGKDIEEKSYYIQIKRLMEKLSKNIGIENVFDERINAISELSTLTVSQAHKKFPNLDLEELEELRQLNVSIHSKIRHWIYKCSQTSDNNSSKEYIKEVQLTKSLDTVRDSKYASIISFVVLYVMLKANVFNIKHLEDSEIHEVFLNTDLRHLVDSKVLDVYIKNYKVFDKIFKDAYTKRIPS